MGRASSWQFGVKYAQATDAESASLSVSYIAVGFVHKVEQPPLAVLTILHSRDRYVWQARPVRLYLALLSLASFAKMRTRWEE